MKLRIRGNSLRLRLSRSEVADLIKHGLVEEAIEFGTEGDQKLIYALEARLDIAQPKAQYREGRIRVQIPRETAAQWAETGQVGITEDVPLGAGRILRLLIEKDFACPTARVGEDDPDAFPHPLSGASGSSETNP